MLWSCTTMFKPGPGVVQSGRDGHNRLPVPTAVLIDWFASGWPHSALRVGVVASDGAACERRNVILRSKLYQRMEAIHGSGAFAITWGYTTIQYTAVARTGRLTGRGEPKRISS